MKFLRTLAVSTASIALAFGIEARPVNRLRQTRGEKVVTADDFLKGRVERGSGKELTLRVSIRTGLPPYTIRIVPNPAATSVSGNTPQNAGRIEISKDGSNTIDQTIDVESFGDGAMLVNYFTMEDINFDGYLDIGTLYEFGAKWGAYNFLVFDPPSGRFISNDFTRQLEGIKANKRKLDPEHKTIHFSFLTAGEGRIGETYEVANGTLILTLFEDRRKSKDGGFEIVTSRIHNGEMTVLGVRKEQQSNQ